MLGSKSFLIGKLLKDSFNPRPHGLGLARPDPASIDYRPAPGREAGGSKLVQQPPRASRLEQR